MYASGEQLASVRLPSRRTEFIPFFFTPIHFVGSHRYTSRGAALKRPSTLNLRKYKMSKLTFLGLAEKVLREENRPLSPAEIWKHALAKGYDQQVASAGKTPAQSLYSMIFTNTRDHSDTIFTKLGQRPARYFLRELLAGRSASAIEKAIGATDDAASTQYDYSEADLHPLLAFYSRLRFKAYTKTICHLTSRRKEFGEWVHPDVIGVYYALEDWKPELLDLSSATGNPAVKLYSFELKKAVSFTNLREAFFQSVSNSSWAHEGYLAAAEISRDEDFLGELRRLSAAFGIGVISLSVDDPDSSEVLFPAREREALDWETLNKLTMNNDVLKLLTRIKRDLQTNEIRREEYDPVPSPEEIVKRLKKTKIDSTKHSG